MPATARKIVGRPSHPRGDKRVKRMTPAELEKIARKMVAAADKDPAEADRLEELLVRGFCGDE